jgi:hypothetical protein
MHNENFVFLGTTHLPILTNSSLKYKKEKKKERKLGNVM